MKSSYGDLRPVISFFWTCFVISEMEIIKTQHLLNHPATLMLREDLFKQLIPEQDLKDENKSDIQTSKELGVEWACPLLPVLSYPDHHVALPQPCSLPARPPPTEAWLWRAFSHPEAQGWGPGARLRRPSGPQGWRQGEKKNHILSRIKFALSKCKGPGVGKIFIKEPGTSLVVQWLVPVQETQVQSLVRELRSHMPQSSWDFVPQLLSPYALEPTCHYSKVCAMQQKIPCAVSKAGGSLTNHLFKNNQNRQCCYSIESGREGGEK